MAIPIPDYTPTEISKFINIILIFSILGLTLFFTHTILKILINLHILVNNCKKYFRSSNSNYTSFQISQDAEGV